MITQRQGAFSSVAYSISLFYNDLSLFPENVLMKMCFPSHENSVCKYYKNRWYLTTYQREK